VGDLWSSVRQVVRSFYRHPGFAIAAVLVLGIGVGAVSLMFSTFNTVVLQPLPFREPDRLVWLWSRTPSGDPNSTSFLDYVDFRDGTDAFESLAAFMLFRRAQILTGGDEAERVNSYRVTANLFATLGVVPAIGRAFRLDEEHAGQDQVAILSHAFWQRRYGGNAAAVGSRLTLDGQTVEIVGVMPAGFDYPAETDLWLPAQQAAGYAAGRGNNNFFVIGRLRDGVSLAQAQAQLDVVARNLADTYPDTKKGWGISAVSLHDRYFGSARASILTLMAIISLVPVVACANVASLFLARAVSRRGEFATRLALGASRARLIRQLITESVVVALAGGALGLLLAYEGGDLMRILAPAALPRLEAIRIDGTVLGFTLLVSLMLVPLFGTVPALRATDIGIAQELKAQGGRGTSDRRSTVRSTLVVAQVALSVILLFGSGLLLESFRNLQRADLGFRPDHLLSFQVQLPVYKYDSPERAQQAWDGVRDRLEALPGVRAVGAVDRMPFLGRGPLNSVWPKGQPPASAAEARDATRRLITEGYFAAMGIGLRAGRVFEPADSRGDPLVTVINEKLARGYFPGQDPIGRSLMLPWDNPPLELHVVGVTADVSELGADADAPPTFYLPAGITSPNTMSMLVRTSGDPLSMASAVRQVLRDIDPDIPMSQVTTMSARLSGTLAEPKFRATMVAIFALVSLVLSAVGLYGLLAYFARQQRRDTGIRLALGAGRSTVLRLVVGRGMVLVAWGCALGIAGAVAGARVISSQQWLFGVGAADPVTLVGVVAFLVLVALVACLVPAYRAARTNPAEVMQAE
jgi:putative ABC transport system permease protein